MVQITKNHNKTLGLLYIGPDSIRNMRKNMKNWKYTEYADFEKGVLKYFSWNFVPSSVQYWNGSTENEFPQVNYKN